MVSAATNSRINFDSSLKVGGVKKFILSIFIIFLPFGQALTINLFFPLKISEIGILLFIGYSAINFLFNANDKVVVDKISGVIILFITMVFLSTIINFFKTFSYEVDLSNVRTSKNTDSFLKFFYLILAFVAMRMTYVSIKTYGRETVLKWFFLGAIISSAYSWYLAISSGLNLPYYALPGMDPVPQNLNLSFGRVIRCGTFKEGNYMGLYLFIAGVLANYSNKIKLTVFFFITILTTFSTISFICVGVYIFLNAFQSRGSKIKALIGLVFLVIALTVLMTKSEDFRTIVVNKIFADEEVVQNQNDIVSRLDRLNTSQIGLQLFADNLLWGVGPANFGLHFNQYNELPQLGEGDYKRIPNNVYVEILSESGIFASLLFFWFIVLIIMHAIKIRNFSFTAGLILTFIYLFSFPTYTMMYIWFFWGFVVTQTKINRKAVISE